MKITKKHLIGIVLFLFLFLTYAGVILNAPKASADSLWERQVGNTEMGRPFGEANAGARDIRLMVIYVIKVFLTFVGIIMLILMMWAGFKWMTAAGDESKVEEAKKRAEAMGALMLYKIEQSQNSNFIQ